MSDEQIIYIGPEDDLTSIRERLEKVDSKSVTLVIPANTQLRSHVAWKVLYMRVRELGKDVLIVSSDPQIRSVAHAVKFRVANSLETSAQSKSRPGSRPGRTGRARTSGLSSSRSSTAKSPAELRGVSGSSTSSSARSQHPSEQLDTLSRGRGAERSQQGQTSRRSQADETITGAHKSRPDQFSPATPFEYHINTVPPIRPLPSEQLEEEPDLLLEDYNQAQGIREAAYGSKKPQQKPGSEEPQVQQPVIDEQQPAQRRFKPLPKADEDPFAYMDDALPPPLPAEQRGAVSFEPFDTSEHVIQDVPDLPTQIIEGNVEYEDDDSGAFLPASQQELSQAEVDEDEDMIGPTGMGTYNIRPHGSNPHVSGNEEVSGPTGVYNVRPHGSNPRIANRRASESPSEEDMIDDVLEDQPTRILPPESRTSSAQRPSQKSASSSRRSTPLQQPSQSSRRSTPLQQPSSRRSTPLQQPAQSARRSTPLQQPVARDRVGVEGAARRPAAQRPAGSRKEMPPTGRAGRQSTGSAIPVVAVIILIFIILGGLGFFLPTADVTLTLKTSTFAHALTLVAHPSNQQAAGVVPAQLETHTFTQNGTATATGSKKVGKNAASGEVTFINQGKRPVIIPTGTVISTANGILFTTLGELSVDVPGNPGNSVPVPVQAKEAGDNGNVAAGAISVIPQDSLNAIARNNNVAATDLNIKVANAGPTTGGGLGNAHTILQKDLDAEQNTLNTQAQPSITAWLKLLSITDYASKPSTQSALVNPPQDGQVVNDVNVPLTLKVTVSVLVVHNNDLQKAAATQLDQLMVSNKTYDHNYMVLNDEQHPIVLKPTKTPTGDTKSMTFTFNATAQVAPKLAADTIRHEVAGSLVNNARQNLAKTPGVQHVDIRVSPGFVWFVPSWTPHINVKLQPGTSH